MSVKQVESSVAPGARERPPFPLGVPDKFSKDGVLQHYPGNTTVCHIPENSPLLPVLRKVCETLKLHPIFSKYLHFLPPASWHMTVFDGVREKERIPGLWPAGKESQPLDECTKEFAPKLRQLGLELEKEGLSPPYRMRVRGFDDTVAGIGLSVVGETPQEEKRMRRLRDEIANRMGFKAPNHESYGFHVGMAYLLRHPSEEEGIELNRVFDELLPAIRRSFELGPVEFNVFDDMYSYPTLFYFGEPL